MPSSRSLLLSALAASVAVSSPVGVGKDFHTIDLEQHQGQADIVQQSLHAASKRLGFSGNKRATQPPLSPETLDAGFWYGTFSVGNTQNLSLLIDTGSSDVAVNPGLYKASSSGKNLGRSGELQYETTQEDGCGVADIKYNTYSDVVSQQGLSSKGQYFGNIVATTPPNSGTITQFPHNGIVGFLGTSGADTQIGGTPFFQNLCNQGQVSQCRFGLAFGTNGKGSQILGGVDTDLINGTLSTASIEGQWELPGNVAINGKVVQQNQDIILDSGTANIVGPPDQVRALFQQLGIQAVEQNMPGCTEVLFGYYPCNKPPTVGFQFGSKNPVFNIEPSAFAQANNGNNNCTAIITGIDLGGIWIVGQAWYQGKYIDHNSAGNSVGIAQLKNKTP